MHLFLKFLVCVSCPVILAVVDEIIYCLCTDPPTTTSQDRTTTDGSGEDTDGAVHQKCFSKNLSFMLLNSIILFLFVF